MLSQITVKILDLISNGSWHQVEDVAENLKTPVREVTDKVNSLSEAGVLVYDERANKVKLSQWFLEIEEKAEAAGKKSIVGSIILPPDGQVSIQSIVISNFLDKPIELGITSDAKLREISVNKAE
jgi:hypothetical protein